MNTKTSYFFNRSRPYHIVRKAMKGQAAVKCIIFVLELIW